MARHIEPPAERTFTGVRVTNEKYPWADWCDGLWWEATQGEDFTCGMDSLRAALHFHAKRYGGTVRTAKIDDTHMAFVFIF